MPTAPVPSPSAPAAPGLRIARRLRLLAGLLWASGWAAALLLWRLGGRPAVLDALDNPEQHRVYDYTVERIGGKGLLLADHFNDWVGSLWQGPKLPWTVALLSLLAALVCLWLAGLWAEPPHEAAEPPP